MKRRALLKAALALPMIQSLPPAKTTARMAEGQPRPPDALSVDSRISTTHSRELRLTP